MEALSPQITVISSLRDRDRILPLLESLRGRGVRLWWDGADLLPGEEWESAIQKMVAIAPLTCFLISEATLSSSNFPRMLEYAVSRERRIVLVRLDRIDPARLPQKISDVWIDFLEPRDLEPAVESILRVLSSIEGRGSEPRQEVPGKEASRERAPRRERPRKRDTWPFASKASTPPSPNMPPPGAEPVAAAQGAATGAQKAPSSEPDLWTLAAPDLKQAFGEAAGLATSLNQDSGRVTTRELFVTILKDSSDDFAALIAPFAKLDGEDASAPAWSRIHRKLRLPTISVFTTTSLPSCDEPVSRALAKAVAMREKPNEPLTCELVFLALFSPDAVGESAAIDPTLTELGVDAEPFLEKLRDAFAANGRRSAALVGEIIALRRPYQPWDRPHVDNDRVEGAIPPDRDLLDVRKPALRFAKLLAATDVHPPIALGLFGNWGSGKTFFMGLMRDRIADLSKNGGPGYVRRVVQIEFNAWHYHDTNLWASLAMRIFEGLARELGGAAPSDVEKKRKELHQRIRSSASRRNEAVEQRDQALDRRADAAKELESLRIQREEHRTRSVTLQLRAAWSAVSQGEAFRQLRTEVDDLQKNFGIDVAIHSAENLRKLKNDIDDTRAHALGIFTAIGRRFHGRKAVAATVATLALAVLSAVALGWGLEWLDKMTRLNLPQFSGTLVQIATMVSAIAAWCGCRVRELRGALDTIGAVEAELAAAEKRVNPDDEMKEIEVRIAELDKDIHKKTEELSAAEREIAEATAEIERINRGGLVYDFLKERASAAPYVGQLGLISTIRQDIERLDVLLNDFVEQGENPIGRIVLYIDDLDRCHPDKVVEVLQAVHLLLAFRLFNVVVGVDARWLERSLHRQYVGDASGEPAGPLARPEDVFSAQDYLEKIFQIPYALAPIGESGFKTLIDGLIETRSEWREKALKKESQSAAERAAAQNLAANNLTDGLAASGQSADIPAATDQEQTKTGLAAGSPAGVVAASEARLFFEDHEQEFMERLYAFVDRPRLAKRFINIYRLLRVRADDEGESERFAARVNSPDFRAALILLAIHVGHPNVAAKVTQAIESARKPWPDLPGLLAAMATGRGESVECSEREREEIALIIDKFVQIGISAPREMDSYVRWAPRVGCFSFDWHRVPVRRNMPSAAV